MRFGKYHGAGNDFVVIDARTMDVPWSALAIRMCDRHYGIGSDGLILICSADDAALRMRMFNPDGSEAEACGNGLRCFVKYVVDHGLVSANSFRVQTAGGTREVNAFVDGDGCVVEAEVEMGVPRFQPEEIPALLPSRNGGILQTVLEVAGHTIPVNLVSMGNPHAVAFISQDVATYPLERVGPAVEHHPLFPARVNFEIARVHTRHEVEARVWERGAGETLACGSGACAIAVASQLLGHCDPGVDIHLPGGVLTISWKGHAHEVVLQGPVQHVFDGEWPD